MRKEVVDRMTRGQLLVGVALLVSSACEDERAPVRTRFTGCAEVRAGPVCSLVETSTLTLWIESPTPPKIFASGRPHPHVCKAIDSGYRCTLNVRSNASSVAARVDGHASWRLSLERDRDADWAARVTSLRRAGDFAQAERLLRSWRANDIRNRARRAGVDGRLAMARAETEEAIARLTEATTLAEEAGLLSEVTRNRAALSLLLTNSERFDEARRVLDPLASVASDWADHHILHTYHRALVEIDTGNVREVLKQLRKVTTWAARVGDNEMLADARTMRIATFLDLGRRSDARPLVDDMIRDLPTGPECRRAESLVNVAEFLEPYCEEPDVCPQALAFIDEGIRLLESACQRPDNLAYGLTQRARVFLRCGRPRNASASLARAKSVLRRAAPWIDLERIEMEARIAEADGRREDALSAYTTLSRRGEVGLSHGLEWTGVLGSARVLEAMGRVDRALSLYERADALVDLHQLNVPLQDGRGKFIRAYGEGTRARIGLLLDLGRVESALTAARHTRARLLDGLIWRTALESADAEQRSAWERARARYRSESNALDEALAESWGDTRLAQVLREKRVRQARKVIAATFEEALAITRANAPTSPQRSQHFPAGELQLFFAESDRGLVGFSVLDQSYSWFSVEPKPDTTAVQAWGGRIVEHLTEQIRRSRGLRVMAYGDIHAIDFHAVPFDGSPLIAAVPVVYGVDIGNGGAGPPVQRALVVGDPANDLPGARDEARVVASALRSQGWEAVLLIGDEATRTRVIAELDRGVSILHFAGHASATGADSWGGELRMTEGTLTVGDILSLKHTPSVVVLSSCNAAAMTHDAPTGLSLANAFVSAGADLVLAATRDIDDVDGRALMVRTYERIAMPREDALASAFQGHFRDAQLADAAAGGDIWRAFRMIVR
ncbi:MAG: CHAT domain-containing protein [Deltaproteobacteria bacterium]